MKVLDDYKILRDTDIEDLEIEVKRYVKEKGYELFGSPFYQAHDTGLARDYICQAVVKYSNN